MCEVLRLSNGGVRLIRELVDIEKLSRRASTGIGKCLSRFFNTTECMRETVCDGRII